MIEGYTQAQLAARAGVSRSHISRIENGLQIPKATSILKIAACLSVDSHYLLMSAAFTALNAATSRKNETLSEIIIALKTKER